MSMKKPQLGMSARKTVGNTVYHIFMVALSVIMIYPFIWSLLSSFKSSEQLYGCLLYTSTGTSTQRKRAIIFTG